LHSKECTETFYIERIVENINLKDTPESIKTETIEMLKQIDLEKFSKLEISDELINQLESLNLNENIQLQELSKELQEDFKKSLKDGRVSTWMTTWEPFWLKKKIELEINQLPPIDSLTKIKLSESLQFNLIDLL
jgi:hypothetical protein